MHAVSRRVEGGRKQASTRHDTHAVSTHQVTCNPVQGLLQEPKVSGTAAGAAHGYHSLVALLDPHHGGGVAGLVV